MESTAVNTNAKPLAYWLFACCALVCLLIIVGAITRLTESGLSITEWRPITGALPPLNEADWHRAFDLYKASPEFSKKHFWMELDDFKKIYFWEWFHRLLGRLVGAAFGLPLLWFWLRKRIPQGYGLKLFGLLLLGGAQGFMGWYMVKSGLVDVPAVSHYRLAAHLSLALLILCLMGWLGLSFIGAARRPDRVLYGHGWAALGFVILTIFWGAYTAGLDAGLIYNESFPLMGGQIVPPEMWFYQPFWINFFENQAGVQFTHRWLAMTTGIVLLSYVAHALKRNATPFLIFAIGAMVFIQIGLGIATLLSMIALPLAVLHQAGAVVLLLLLVASLHRFYPHG